MKLSSQIEIAKLNGIDITSKVLEVKRNVVSIPVYLGTQNVFLYGTVTVNNTGTSSLPNVTVTTTYPNTNTSTASVYSNYTYTSNSYAQNYIEKVILTYTCEDQQTFHISL